MDELVAFLKARLAEDEMWARHLPDEEAMVQGTMTGALSINHVRSLRMVANTARVLREVEAKRRLVDRYAWLREHGDTGDAAWVLPLLAAAYADHPDFRPDWAPEDTGG